MKDSEIKRFCLDFRKGILEGKPSNWMCFAISAPLETLLNMSGVPVVLIEGEAEFEDCSIDHVWLQLPDGRIIDTTADQFNEYGHKFPKVYIGEKPEFYKSVV